MDQPLHDPATGAWPPGLTRIPYWVYRDPEIARDEQIRVFEGPAWHFLCLEIDIPQTGDYRTTMMGAMPVVVEDDVLVGGNCGIYEGTVVKRRAVLGTGTILNRSTPVYDLVRNMVHRAEGD